MKDAVIVSGARTATGKGRKGTLRTVRPDDLGACVIREAVDRAKGLEPADVEDVLMGCAIPEQEQGMNVARIASLKAGLPVTTPAATINRLCSSGIQTISQAFDQVRCGHSEVVVAGGTEARPPALGVFLPTTWLARTLSIGSRYWFSRIQLSL